MSEALQDAHVRAWQGRYGQARAFLQRLDPEALRFTFQTFDDDPLRKARELARIVCADPTNGALDKLAALNARGAGVFVTVNATDGKGRQEHNVERVRAVFVDLDGVPLAPVLAAGLEPHIVVESSPGKYHAYWLCDDCPLDQFERVQLALARRFGGDPSVQDLPRVMRLPGFRHLKGEACTTRLLDELGSHTQPYPLATIVKTLELDLTTATAKPAPGNGEGKIGKGERHAHLFASGRAMRARGMSREAVQAGLTAENAAQLDPPLPPKDVDYLVERAFSAKDAADFEGVLPDLEHYSGAKPQSGDAHEGRAADPGVADEVKVGGLFAMARTLPDTEFVISPILPRGQLGTLTGHPGSGKTTLFIGMYVAAALDRTLGPLTRRGDGLLYVVSAEDIEGTRDRVLAEAIRHQLTPQQQAQFDGRVRWVHVPRIVTPGVIHTKIEEDRVTGCGGQPVAHIFVDTGPALFPGDDENDAVQLRDYTLGLARLLGFPGRPGVSAAWHPTKSATRDRLLPRGAGAVGGSTSYNLTTWNDDDNKVVTLHHMKLRSRPFDEMCFTVVRIELPSKTADPVSAPILRYIEQGDDDGKQEVRLRQKRVLLALAVPQPPGVRELARLIDVPRSTAHRDLQYLVGCKLVAKDALDDDRHTLTKAGQERARVLRETGEFA